MAPRALHGDQGSRASVGQCHHLRLVGVWKASYLQEMSWSLIPGSSLADFRTAGSTVVAWASDGVPLSQPGSLGLREPGLLDTQRLAAEPTAVPSSPALVSTGAHLAGQALLATPRTLRFQCASQQWGEAPHHRRKPTPTRGALLVLPVGQWKLSTGPGPSMPVSTRTAPCSGAWAQKTVSHPHCPLCSELSPRVPLPPKGACVGNRVTAMSKDEVILRRAGLLPSVTAALTEPQGARAQHTRDHEDVARAMRLQAKAQ